MWSISGRTRCTRLAILGAASCGSLFAAAPAAAATITVPDDHPTIQDAVDAADPGDVIQVRDGRYEENVVVTTNDLAIAGLGDEVIVEDASAEGNESVFDVVADDFALGAVRIRHGDIDCAGDRCQFAAIEVRGLISGDCVEIDGEDAVVRASELEACGDSAVDVDGDGALVRDNNARLSNNQCFEIFGDDLVFRSNKALNCEDGEGLDHSGDDPRILENLSRSTDADGFEVDGDGMLFRGNRAVLTEDVCFDLGGDDALVRENAGLCGGGFDVDGENPVLESNFAVPAEDDGFNVDCSGACDAGALRDNVAIGNSDDDEGFDVFVDSGLSGFTISGNRATDNNSDGFEITADGALIEDNIARRNGAEGEPGFDVFGDDNVLRRNSAYRSGGAGIEINGGANFLGGNYVEDNNREGIEIEEDALGTGLLGNLAIDNLGDGIANEGDDTSVVRNGAAGNKVDCANDGTIAVNEDNDCRDGSDFMEPGSNL